MDYLKHAPGERIYFGGNPETTLRSVLAQRPGEIVLFTGRSGAQKSGALACFEKVATELQRPWRIFAEIEAEPVIATVEKMRDFLRQGAHPTVVAMGGGSVLDAAKAAFLLAQSGQEIDEHFGVNRFTQAHPDCDLARIIAIPTTSGTGSEATAYSNIVDPVRQVKKLIVEEQTVPEVAIVVPEFNASMPQAVTLATGCDALAHLLEGFLNVGADANHPEANAWALHGIELIVQHLPEAVKYGAGRSEMALAATLGGMTIRYKSTGLPHLCSFSWFGRIPHGMAVALLLPASWRYYLGNPQVAARTMELKHLFPGATPEEVVGSYRKFMDQLGMPQGLRSYPDITPELLALTARSAAENRMKLELAPRPVPLEQSREILSKILEESY